MNKIRVVNTEIQCNVQNDVKKQEIVETANCAVQAHPDIEKCFCDQENINNGMYAISISLEYKYTKNLESIKYI